MKIAVTYSDGKIFQHFGHTEQFKVYYIQDNSIKNTEIITSTEGGHSALSKLLKDNNIDALICGGIGGGAKTALKDLNIKLYGGVSGDCDEAVNDFINGKLCFEENPSCKHFEEHHSGEKILTCHDANGCNHNCH